MGGIEPGDKVSITHDIIIDGQIAFRNGDQIVVEKIEPNARSPRHQFIVFSPSLQQRFQLSSTDLRETGRSEPDAQHTPIDCMHQYINLQDGSLFCKKCGSNITRSGVNLPSIPKYCGDCGAEVDPQSIVCGSCGAPNTDLILRKACVEALDRKKCKHDFRFVDNGKLCINSTILKHLPPMN